ncbi:hypothetical protein [Nannocystis punicea]|uniref:Uncharacterized protein n=1 Tax=Nannocystis punicea TaxID=2995304 RepID=A0ABY7H8C9_9BACT|nr:hypothetical protein [Nannocystis poenicansa]WAS95512.1 hypothetical protein O0S08_05065 [Nannocystis poenicansa]
MSTAEISDNKWELEASRPPIGTTTGVLQIVVIAVFAGLFVWMLSFALRGIFGAQRETLADQYGRLTVDGKPAAAPAPR